ncbi:MAG: IS982 family transposase [Actinobacteria bacterium]|nr:IS982 family transposase [Actinomycetota bacterium]
MNADLDALAVALYVTIDDILIARPDLVPARPQVGIAPRLSDAELLTLAVIQALLGFTSEARFIRHAHAELGGLFPFIPDRPGYNKRLRHSIGMLRGVLRVLAMSCGSWHDDLWLIDSTPVECGRSRETAKRSDLVGAAGYGYCASHSRYFWGLRLHLIATPSGLPIAFALASPKEDERAIARDMLEIDPALLAERPGQTIIADKGYRSAELEAMLADHGATLIRPNLKGERPRPGQRFLKPFRQIIESINQTLKAQLDLERHAARKIDGVAARVLQRLLALTAVIWHNEQTAQPTLRSLTAYDH